MLITGGKPAHKTEEGIFTTSKILKIVRNHFTFHVFVSIDERHDRIKVLIEMISLDECENNRGRSYRSPWMFSQIARNA
jgi:hypothetical protein